MAKIKNKSSASRNLQKDSIFLFKVVLFLILGSQWLYISTGSDGNQIPIPVGALIGVGFILKDPRPADRKLEYVLVLLAMFIGFWLPMGITLLT